MDKQIHWIHFKEGYDMLAVYDIVEKFREADMYYEDNAVRFFGTSERFQEFQRAIATVEEVDSVV